jgi:hypothetical protein
MIPKSLRFFPAPIVAPFLPQPPVLISNLRAVMPGPVLRNPAFMLQNIPPIRPFPIYGPGIRYNDPVTGLVSMYGGDGVVTEGEQDGGNYLPMQVYNRGYGYINGLPPMAQAMPPAYINGQPNTLTLANPVGVPPPTTIQTGPGMGVRASYGMPTFSSKKSKKDKKNKKQKQLVFSPFNPFAPYLTNPWSYGQYSVSNGIVKSSFTLPNLMHYSFYNTPYGHRAMTWGMLSSQEIFAWKSENGALDNEVLKKAFETTISMLLNWWKPGSINLDTVILSIQVTDETNSAQGTTKKINIVYTSYIFRHIVHMLINHVHAILPDNTTENVTSSFNMFANPSPEHKLNKDIVDAAMETNRRGYLAFFLYARDEPDNKKLKDLVWLVATKGNGGVNYRNQNQLGGQRYSQEVINTMEAMFAQNVAQQFYAEIIKTGVSNQVPNMINKLNRLIPAYQYAYAAAKHYTEKAQQ